MNTIDTHAHLYPARYLDFLEEHGVDPSTTQIARNMRASDEPEEMAARLKQMDDAGVAEQILSVTPQVPMLADAKDALAAARLVNDIYEETMQSYPGRFRSYLALPVPHVAESLTILDEYFDREGFIGVGLPTVIQGTLSIADDSLLPLYERLNELGARVYIHATGGGASSGLLTEHGLVWVNGAPVEDAVAVLHLLKADIPARFPKIRFHIAHLAGDLPFLAQRIEDNYTDWDAFNHSPAQTLRSMWFDTANFHGPSLLLAADAYGVSQLMMGSDYPYFQDAQYTRAVEYVQGASLHLGDQTIALSPDDTDAILTTNAQKFFS